MTMSLWIGIGVSAGTFLVVFLARKWQRRQRASRLADVLLSDVLKAKDSYRR
jgi:hypothetical protein